LVKIAILCIIGCYPTYGELIDVFEEFEGRPDAADLLCMELCQRYPHIKIGRSSRLLYTVKCFIAPTRPNTLGSAKLTGSPLAHFRKRVWEPRIRTTGTGEVMFMQLQVCLFKPSMLGGVPVFPLELAEEGLSQKALGLAVEQVRTGCAYCSWKLTNTPTIGFYRHLHAYLKGQQNLSKVLIGRLYLVIDTNFQEKASRPDNTYRFVENTVTSERQSESPMLYNIPVVKSTSSMLNKCSEQIKELNAECSKL
jgi:hypothetical protein